MKLSPVPQNILEWIGLKAGMVPTPLAYSHFGFITSKIILEATDKGIFEAIGNKKVTLQQIANTCSLNERALYSLLAVLATMGLLNYSNPYFSLTSAARKWLLKDSKHSLYWLMMFDNRVCFRWMDHVGKFLETGEGLQYHHTFNDEEWFFYQQAMENAALATSKEATRKIPMPAHPTLMLDIGGSHGLYSVELCKKHPTLRSIILDLPAAVEKAKPILDKYRDNLEIEHRPGNIITDEIGENRFDFVLMASVAHHLTGEENAQVAQKVFRALKPGGHFTILEVLRRNEIKLNGNMLASIADFFFALSSTSGTWTLEEIKSWQKQAGFTHLKKSSFLTIPGYVAITAVKK